MIRSKRRVVCWQITAFLIVAAFIFNYVTYQINQNIPEKKIVWESPEGKSTFRHKYSKKKQPVPQLSIARWLIPSKPIKQLKGQAVLLDFWGVWCGPCCKALPHTQKIYEKYKDQGLVVIGIHSSYRTEKTEKFIAENHYTFPIGIDNGQTAEDYYIRAWPTYCLIDKQGYLAWGPESGVPPDNIIESILKTIP